MALVGDWNIAPLDTDVWDMAWFAGRTHVSPAEREAFTAIADAGYTEVSRVHLPAEHTYTYWDYQQLRFPRNEGMRIDLTYATPALAARVTGAPSSATSARARRRPTTCRSCSSSPGDVGGKTGRRGRAVG